MKPANQPQNKVNFTPTSVFISAVLLSVAGLAIEGIAMTSAGKFFGGFLIGMSIACLVLGFIMYTQTKKK